MQMAKVYVHLSVIVIVNQSTFKSGCLVVILIGSEVFVPFYPRKYCQV